MKACACASLAALLSVTLFALLLRVAPRGQQQGQRWIAVSLVGENAASLADPSQGVEAAALALADAGSDDYLPVTRLSERPQVVRDIDPEWPWTGIDLPVLVCTLLINEYGDVDRVLLHEPPLSPMLEADIRARFLAARFVPGKLHGQPVKAALRIEIRLD